MSFGGGWGGSGGGGSGYGGGHHNPATPYRPTSHTAFRTNNAASTRPPCKFWAAGTCNRGDKCDFSHAGPRGAGRGGGGGGGAGGGGGGGWGGSAGVWGGAGGAAAVLSTPNPFQSATASSFNTFTSPPSSSPLPLGQSAFSVHPSQQSNPFAAAPAASSAFGPLATPNPFSSLAQPGLGSGSAFSQPFGGGGGATALAPSNPFAPAASPFAQQQQQPQSLLFPSSNPPNPFQQSSLSNPFQSPLTAFGPLSSTPSAFASPTAPAPVSAPSASFSLPSPLPCGHGSLRACVEAYKLDMQHLLYPFTSYSHDNCAGVCITGDVSYEEWRWDVVQASAQGQAQMGEAMQRWEQRRKEAMAVREWMLVKPELLHRDVTGWTWEQLVSDMRANGVGEGLTAPQGMNTMNTGMMSVNTQQPQPAAQPFAASAQPFGGGPFAALPPAPSTGAMESSSFSAGGAAPFGVQGMASGPPGGAAVTGSMGMTAANAPAAASPPLPSAAAAPVVSAMSKEEEAAAFRASAFQWGRIPETPPPIS